ncbi:MAG: glutathione peroxidase [Candidatus Omnitrophota bacterium]
MRYSGKLWMAIALVCFLAAIGRTEEKVVKDPQKAKNIYEFAVKDIDGKEVKLNQYKEKKNVLLIVNTASQCGFTKQYAPLMDVYKKYKEKGLVVIAFPANEFGQQEPGTADEIKKFCETKYNVKFPIMAKSVVKGEKQAPLFQYLTNAENPDFTGEIKWNFEKFLIDKKGKLIRRFRSKEEPDGEEIAKAIEKALAEKE